MTAIRKRDGRKGSLAAQFALGAGLLAVVIILALGLGSYLSMRVLTVEHLQTAMADSAAEAGERIKLRLTSLEHTVSSLASNTLIGNALVDDFGRDRYLRSFLDDFDSIDGVPVTLAVTDFRGRSFARSQEEPLVVKPAWVAGVVQSARPSVTAEMSGAECYLVLSHPVIFANTGRPEGAMVLQVAMRSLLDAPSLWSLLEDRGLEPALAFHYLNPNLGRGESVEFGGDTDGLVGIRASLELPAPLDGLRPELEVFVDPARIASPLGHLLWMYLAAAVATLLFVVWASRALARSLTRRLLLLETATREISFDNIDRRRVQVQGNDEVSRLGGTFNSMLERLEGAYDELKSNEARLRATVESLQEARRAADAANRAKTEFLANMSHELRTPLNAILGFSRLLEQTCRGCPSQQSNLAVVIRSGEHLLDLINDLLDVSRIEAGRMEIAVGDVDLHQLLDDVAGIIALRAQERGLIFRQERAPDLIALLRTDPGKLRQILLNLLSNAVKYTDRGRVVLRVRTFATKPDALQLRMEVEDTGRGIPESDRERVFEKFVQVSRQGQEGTGLGLTITRSFVELMGGAINLHSEEGKGSRFTVTIPVEPALGTGASGEERGRVLGLIPGAPVRRHLVVDDDSENRMLLSRILRDAGFAVKTVASGEAALEMCAAWHPHLVWMDLRMPGLNGYETTQQIKSLAGNRECRIIAVSAAVSAGGSAELRAAGIDDFLAKPFRPARVLDLAERHLGMRLLRAPAARVESPAGPLQGRQRAAASEELADLPEAWRGRFHRATVEGRIEDMEELLGEIRAQHPGLAERLATLTRDYRLDVLLDLMDAPG